MRMLARDCRQLAAAAAASGSATYVYAIGSLDVLPPVQPAVILNAGANYPEHAQGIVAEAARAAAAAGPGAGTRQREVRLAVDRRGAPRQAAVSKPGLWERTADDPRPDNPYLFLKSPSVMVGANDDVVVPRGT